MAQSFTEKPKVTLVIPLLNGEKTAAELLVRIWGGYSPRLHRQVPGLRYPADRIEFQFFDMGSQDRTEGIVREQCSKHKNSKILKLNQSTDPASLMMLALRSGTGDFILFLEQDCLPDRFWIQNMLKPFRAEPQVGIVGGEIHTIAWNQNQKSQNFSEQTGYQAVLDRMDCSMGGLYPQKELYPRRTNGSRTTPFFELANLAIRRETAQKIADVAQGAGFAYSLDLSLQSLKVGSRLYFQPDAVVQKLCVMDIPDYYRAIRKISMDRVLSVKNHARRFLEIRIQSWGGFSLLIPFPFAGLLYIGDFHLMHLLGVGALVELAIPLVQKQSLGEIVGDHILMFWWAFFIFFLFKYFTPVMKISPRSSFGYWCWMRYRSNLERIWGGLLGSLKYGRLYLDESYECR